MKPFPIEDPTPEEIELCQHIYGTAPIILRPGLPPLLVDPRNLATSEHKEDKA